MTNDDDRGSNPSTGSVGEPVAWAVALADGERIYDVYAIEEEAKAIDEAVTGNHGVVPLYRHPQNGVVVQLPRLLWDSSEKMGKGEWDYQQRVKTALEVAGVKWAVVE